MEDRYRILFDHASDAHLIIQDGGLIDCNQAAIDLIGCESKDDLLALHPSVLAPEIQPDGTPSSKVAERVDALAHERGVHRFEYMHQTVKGEPLPVQVTLNSAEMNGKPALIAVWHDLREIKQREREQQRLSDELRVANDKMRNDLEAAAAVQSALLPHVLPEVDGVGIEWAFQPCDELAGDILNVFLLDSGHLAFYVLDVSGHGVASSLLSVTASHFLAPGGHSSLFRGGDAEAKRHVASPTEIASRLNEQLAARGGPVQFLTLFCGILDLDTHELCFTCAAHPGATRVMRDGTIHMLEHPGLPIGVVKPAEYQEERVVLEPGDRLYVFSDGIPEARDADQEQYGMERVRETILAARSRGLRASIDEIIEGVRVWCRPGKPQDDISLLALEIR